MLQSVTEYYRVLQNITEYYRMFLAHLLGPIFGLVYFRVFQGILGISGYVRYFRVFLGLPIYTKVFV